MLSKTVNVTLMTREQKYEEIKKRFRVKKDLYKYLECRCKCIILYFSYLLFIQWTIISRHSSAASWHSCRPSSRTRRRRSRSAMQAIRPSLISRNSPPRSSSRTTTCLQRWQRSTSQPTSPKIWIGNLSGMSGLSYLLRRRTCITTRSVMGMENSNYRQNCKRQR